MDVDVLSPPAIATNTNEPISQSIFNYTNSHAELREVDGYGFDLSARLAVTTLLTTIVIKTENMLHMETVQSAIAANCNTIITINDHCRI